MKSSKFLIVGALALLAVFVFVPSGCMLPEEEENKETSDKVWLGVVGFNSNIVGSGTDEIQMSRDFVDAKNYIDELNYHTDGKAICYALSHAASMASTSEWKFGLEHVYIVSFTNGNDDLSADLYRTDDPSDTITQSQVYDRARANLSVASADTYLIGLTKEATLITDNMVKLVSMPKNYKTINRIEAAEKAFRDIADKIVISCSRNVALLTIGNRSGPKYFTLVDSVSSAAFKLQYSAVTENYTLSDETSIPGFTAKSFIVQRGLPVIDGNRVRISFKGIERNNSDVSIGTNALKLQVSFTNPPTAASFYTDSIDSSLVPDGSQRVGVILVLDASSSLVASSAHLKEASTTFINMLKNIK